MREELLTKNTHFREAYKKDEEEVQVRICLPPNDRVVCSAITSEVRVSPLEAIIGTRMAGRKKRKKRKEERKRKKQRKIQARAGAVYPPASLPPSLRPSAMLAGRPPAAGSRYTLAETRSGGPRKSEVSCGPGVN
jgi:hypothetical protein